MHVELQPAYVLHARPYRETSLLLEVLSRELGRVGLIARGARGSRGQSLRAQLQPGRPLLLGWRDVGELPVLAKVESGAALPRISGNSLLSLFYVNELLVRLLPRRESHVSVFDRYALLISQLSTPTGHAQALRSFEYGLLSGIGYAPTLDTDADGHLVVSGAHYRYAGEQGLRRLPEAIAPTGADVPGEALLALRVDAPLRPEWLVPLRRLLRQCIADQLNGRPLQSWRLSQLLSGASGPASRLPERNPGENGDGVEAAPGPTADNGSSA
ncbi:MAG: DNA repair protein RecO [Xanthomonadales bacterium]|nr:DNA repair protein RecO [Xanthomonadales bacterium]